MAVKQADITPLFFIGGGILLYFWLRPSTITPSTRDSGQQPGLAPPTSLPRLPTFSGNINTRWVQQSLNKLIGANLVEDGIYGPKTKAAVARFQQMWQITADGIVGPETEYSIRSALGQPGYVELPYTKPLVWY